MCLEPNIMQRVPALPHSDSVAAGMLSPGWALASHGNWTVKVVTILQPPRIPLSKYT